MNFSNTMYLFSAYSVVCAAVVYFVQTMMLGRINRMRRNHANLGHCGPCALRYKTKRLAGLSGPHKSNGIIHV